MARKAKPYSPPAPSPAWTAFALALCLALTLFFFFALLAPGMRHALDTLPHRRFMGIVWAVSTLGIARQLIVTARQGYVYWHHSEVVMKASHPVLYRIWCAVQMLFVVNLALIAVMFLR